MKNALEAFEDARVRAYPFFVQVYDAFAFRFREAGNWSNPILKELDSHAELTALGTMTLVPCARDNRMLIYLNGNDLSVEAGILVDYNLQCQFVAGLKALDQSKKRKSVTAIGRDFENPMSLRIPHL
jgi:hypothetical protein